MHRPIFVRNRPPQSMHYQYTNLYTITHNYDNTDERAENDKFPYNERIDRNNNKSRKREYYYHYKYRGKTTAKTTTTARRTKLTTSRRRRNTRTPWTIPSLKVTTKMTKTIKTTTETKKQRKRQKHQQQKQEQRKNNNNKAFGNIDHEKEMKPRPKPSVRPLERTTTENVPTFWHGN